MTSGNDNKTQKWRHWADVTLDAGVKYGLPIAVTAGLVIWLFNKVNVHQVMQVARNCDYGWVVLMMIITTFSHIIRGLRWGIQLRGAGVPRMTPTAESVSIFGTYALNLVVPRLGEVWRCVWVSRRQGAKISTVVGTLLGDRGSDAVVVMLLFALAMVVSHPAMERFMDHYAVGHEIMAVVSNPWVWAGLIATIAGVWGLLHAGKKIAWVGRVDLTIKRLWQGFAVMFHMKGIGMYLVLTVGIWVCYFLETYVCFFAFPFTRALIHEPGLAWGLVPGLVVFVFGSFSMAVPSNGGLGPWNLAVMFALSLYGVSDTDGTAFSMVMWGSQAAMLVVLGIFSAAYTMRNPSGLTALHSQLKH